MIVEHYPNPNKKTFTYIPPTVVQHYPKDAGGMLNGHGLTFNQHWADKMGVTLSQFIGRDAAVKDAAKTVMFEKNAGVYPVDYDKYCTYGKCRVLAVAKSYRDFHDWDWDFEEGPLYIIEAYSENNKFSVFRATAGFFQSVPPVAPTTT